MFIFDTHVHTSETSQCGKIDARTLVRLYKEAGYHGLVITDHYYRGFFQTLSAHNWKDKINEYLRGYFAALDEGKKIGIKILLGMEIRFDEHPNDYLVYGFDIDFLYKHKKLYTMSLKNFKNFIEGSPMLIYQAHPFRITVEPADPQYLHGVEVNNGNPRRDSHNDKVHAFAAKYGLKMLSGSDFHRTEDLARGGIAIPNSPTTSVELVNLLSVEENVKLLKQ